MPSRLQAIKVCSAGFKQLNDEERRNKQRLLQRHWWVQQACSWRGAVGTRSQTSPAPAPHPRRMREVNAHLLLEGQPRVVRVLHTFQGKMVRAPWPLAAVPCDKNRLGMQSGGAAVDVVRHTCRCPCRWCRSPRTTWCSSRS